MIGAYCKFASWDEPQRVIVLAVDGRRARVEAIGCRPFLETNSEYHGWFNKFGWVSKTRLTGFRSTRITTEGTAHTSNIAEMPAEVTE